MQQQEPPLLEKDGISPELEETLKGYALNPFSVTGVVVSQPSGCSANTYDVDAASVGEFSV